MCVRDDILELVFGRSGTGDVRHACFRRHMVPSMPTRSVIGDREFSSGSLDPCARPLARLHMIAALVVPCDFPHIYMISQHALSVSAALTSPDSQAFWPCHVISPGLYLEK